MKDPIKYIALFSVPEPTTKDWLIGLNSSIKDVVKDVFLINRKLALNHERIIIIINDVFGLYINESGGIDFMVNSLNMSLNDSVVSTAIQESWTKEQVLEKMSEHRTDIALVILPIKEGVRLGTQMLDMGEKPVRAYYKFLTCVKVVTASGD